MKAAHITPTLKKADLDPADAKSYRPISNLSVLSKLLERLVAKQLVTYLRDNSLLPVLTYFLTSITMPDLQTGDMRQIW